MSSPIHVDNVPAHFHNSALLDAINAGFFVLDHDLNIIFWNKWMEKFSQIKADSARKKTLLEVFPQIENTRLHFAIQSNLELGMPAVISNILNNSPLPLFSTQDKQLVPIHQHIQVTRIQRIISENNSELKNTDPYSLLHITDISASVMREKLLESHITKRKIAEEALREARQLAEINNHAKSQFMANMSHEIRTPLNGILGMVELLKDCELDEESITYIDILHESGQSLLGTINDVLDFSKIDSGRFSLSMHSFSLYKLVNFIDRFMRVKATQKGINFQISLSDDLPEFVLGDKTRLRQVLINLVDNAIKFTNNGFVLLKLNIKNQSASKILIDFIVEDTGIGISEENCSKIFNSFSQADGSSTRQYGGTGLGLAISKQLVSLLGGDLVVESKLGKYSAFSFTLALEIDKRESNNTINNDPNSKSFIGHILLVDDKTDTQKATKIILTRLGLKVDVVSTGSEALRKFGKYTYNLIFLELSIPELNGFEVTNLIRAQETVQNLKKTPIVALSSNELENERIKCKQVGMDDFMIKPLLKNDLTRILQTWLASEAG